MSEVDVERDALAATRSAFTQSVGAAQSTEKEVVEIRRQIAEAYHQLSAENAQMLRRREELIRKDPIAKGLHAKLVSAERHVLELRQSLDVRLADIEEVREIEARRKDLMKNVQELKEQERQLLAATAGEVTVESGDSLRP